jgi:hypothetical protein
MDGRSADEASVIIDGTNLSERFASAFEKPLFAFSNDVGSLSFRSYLLAEALKAAREGVDT